jgi:hypothetical protein
MVSWTYRPTIQASDERRAAEAASARLATAFGKNARAYGGACAGLRPPAPPQGGKVRLAAPVHLVGACDRCGTRIAVGCRHYPLEQETGH